jgi:hypothetical protein
VRVERELDLEISGSWTSVERNGFVVRSCRVVKRRAGGVERLRSGERRRVKQKRASVAWLPPAPRHGKIIIKINIYRGLIRLFRPG